MPGMPCVAGHWPADCRGNGPRSKQWQFVYVAHNKNRVTVSICVCVCVWKLRWHHSCLHLFPHIFDPPVFKGKQNKGLQLGSKDADPGKSSVWASNFENKQGTHFQKHHFDHFLQPHNYRTITIQSCIYFSQHPNKHKILKRSGKKMQKKHKRYKQKTPQNIRKPNIT